MARASVPPLDRQVARVRRRLFLQTLLNLLVSCWLGALVLSAVWFFAEPYLINDPSPLLRWYVAGGLTAAGTLLAGVLGWFRAPSLLASALAFDERFRLKERATTGLTLRPEELSSPAGQALLEDVNKRVEQLQVGERFPVRLPWLAGLIPVGALLLALLALFYKPQMGQASNEDKKPLTDNPAVAQEIKDQMRQLQKKGQRKQEVEKKKSADLERLEEERDRLSRAQTETREEAKDVVKQMGNLEEQMQKRDKELAQRADAVREQMKQAERLSGQTKKNGPAKNIDKALDQGDFKKAKQEAERLAKMLNQAEQEEKLRKKLKDPNLSDKEREQIQKELDNLEKKKLTQEEKEALRQQLKDIQEKIERLTRDPEELEKQLREMAKAQNLTPEELERELEQLRKDLAKMDKPTKKAMKELAQLLGQCQQCMKEGKDAEAAEKLRQAAKKLAEMDPEGEREDLAEQMKLLQECREGLCRCLNGNNPASGKRPESKDKDTRAHEIQAKSPFDRGAIEVIDTVDGKGFKGPRKPAELTEEIRQATQEAPEAIDRQRLPRSASDMARGYFEKLRGADKNPKKEP